MEINDFNEWYLDGIDQSDDMRKKRAFTRNRRSSLYALKSIFDPIIDC